MTTSQSGRISDIYNPSRFLLKYVCGISINMFLSEVAFIVGMVGIAILPLITGFLRNKIALFVLRALAGICMYTHNLVSKPPSNPVYS